MQTNSIYYRPHKVEIADVDFTRKIKLSKLFENFQETASMHVDELGIGISNVQAKCNVAWILVRMKVEIIRFPELKEDLIIETWPQKPTTIEYERDFRIKDSSGNIIVNAVSGWILVDIQTHEICKNNFISLDQLLIPKERAIAGKIHRITGFGNQELLYERKIRYTDIDFNGHLNNSRYIDFAMDCLTIDEHKKFRVKSFQVNYTHEALPGDTIRFYTGHHPENPLLRYIEGLKVENNTVVFRALIELTER
jgi:acyl-ACP thioesterase